MSGPGNNSWFATIPCKHYLQIATTRGISIRSLLLATTCSISISIPRNHSWSSQLATTCDINNQSLLIATTWGIDKHSLRLATTRGIS